MSSILCTMPGKYGDILWSLPTARAIAAAAGEPVDFLVSEKYRSICPLIEQQPYIRQAAGHIEWRVQETAPITPYKPDAPIGKYHKIIHLGYQRWPLNALPYEIYLNAVSQWEVLHRTAQSDRDLLTPWITIDSDFSHTHVVIGFTDEWFELKVGIFKLLTVHPLSPEIGRSYLSISGIPGSRWWHEAEHRMEQGWIGAAEVIRTADVFLGCCSALHVLAVGLGVPAIVVEPSEPRHNPIFWPLGLNGPRVTCVTGGDGKPTFDARHVRDAIKLALHRVNYNGMGARG